MEKVSVIIPVYNSENFLRQTIDSILNQSYSDIELIAIDDGSTDNTYSILEEYGSKIILKKQSNLGLAKTISQAQKQAKGKWVKWFSPDDVLYPDAIETMVNESKKLELNTIIYSNWDIIDEKGQVLRTFYESDYNNLSKFNFNVRLLDGQQINVNTSLIPNSLFKMGCTFSKLKEPVAVDYDFFLRAGILFDTKFYLIKKPLIKYRLHSNQLSRKNILGTLSYLKKVRESILVEIPELERQKYLKSLGKYQKNKSINKKTMEFGLNMLKLLPNHLSDKILTFYLNNLRNTR